jgi:hypothetical protein
LSFDILMAIMWDTEEAVSITKPMFDVSDSV